MVVLMGCVDLYYCIYKIGMLLLEIFVCCSFVEVIEVVLKVGFFVNERYYYIFFDVVIFVDCWDIQ